MALTARRLLAAAAAAGMGLLAGCGPGAGPSQGTAPDPEVIVFAAASLTESFTEIGKTFEAANPGTRVTFSFSGSSALATQINQGAPADIFASAAPANMKTVTDAGNADGTPVTLVKNQLVIAVPKGNAKAIRSLPDLAKPAVKVALCAEQVPCGAAARKALDVANVRLTPVTLEQDVKAALSKVKLDEVDAALVYRTDVRAAADSVDGIEFPESAAALNEYPIVLLRDAPHKAAAQAFLAYLRSTEGMAVLIDAGFQQP